MTPRAWLLFATGAVVWGVPYLFVLDERLGATSVLGLGLILAGSWMATRARIVR